VINTGRDWLSSVQHRLEDWLGGVAPARALAPVMFSTDRHRLEDQWCSAPARALARCRSFSTSSKRPARWCTGSVPAPVVFRHQKHRLGGVQLQLRHWLQWCSTPARALARWCSSTGSSAWLSGVQHRLEDRLGGVQHRLEDWLGGVQRTGSRTGSVVCSAPARKSTGSSSISRRHRLGETISL